MEKIEFPTQMEKEREVKGSDFNLIADEDLQFHARYGVFIEKICNSAKAYTPQRYTIK